MDTWYKTKFDDLSQVSTKHVDTMRNTRQEIAGAKKDVCYLSVNLYYFITNMILTTEAFQRVPTK